jgi:hypothetical protein
MTADEVNGIDSYAKRLRTRLEAAHRGDEDRARSELYGSPRQDVTLLGPDHPPTVNSDDAPVLGGRVA